jgi:hypothetical protein
MRRSSHPITIAAVLVALTAGAPAVASATPPAVLSVYDDCEDGTLDKRYTDGQLRAALRDIESHTGEYSECADVIYAAQLGLTGAAGKDAKAARDAAGTAGENDGTAKDGTPAAGEGPADTGGTPATGATPPAADAFDGRGASEAEKAAAVAAATAAADAPASRDAARLLGAAIPAAALEMGATRVAMPLPAVIAVGVCALLGVLAGVAALVTRLTRPRL